LMHVSLAGYHVSDIQFTFGIDINVTKVGKDLSEAIYADPNNTYKFADVPHMDVPVVRGMTHDGLGKYLKEVIKTAPGPTADIAKMLKDTKTDVVLNFLPVGSEMATKWYVEQALEAGVITWSRYAEALNRLNPVEVEQIALLNEQSAAVNNLASDYDGLAQSVEKAEQTSTAGTVSGTTTGTVRAGGGYGLSASEYADAGFGLGARTFAQGGSFIVGGHGGVDSQNVNFKASPGEKVTVSKPNVTNNGGAVTIVMNGVQNVRQFANELADYSRTNPIALNLSENGVIAG